MSRGKHEGPAIAWDEGQRKERYDSKRCDKFFGRDLSGYCPEPRTPEANIIFSKPLQKTILRPWPVLNHGNLLLQSFLCLRPQTLTPLLDNGLPSSTSSSKSTIPTTQHTTSISTITNPNDHPAQPTQFLNDRGIWRAAHRDWTPKITPRRNTKSHSSFTPLLLVRVYRTKKSCLREHVFSVFVFYSANLLITQSQPFLSLSTVKTTNFWNTSLCTLLLF